MKNMLLLSVMLILLNISAEGALNESIIHLIDEKGKNAIFRGNLPIDDQSNFQFSQLEQILSKKAGRRADRIIIISLLNFLTAKQTKNRYIQEKYFEDRGWNGKAQYVGQKLHWLKNFPIFGSYFSPSQLPSSITSWMNKNYDLVTIDPVNQIIAQLQLRLRSPIPTFIYVHCSAGIDRTGLVQGAYKMKKFNAPFKTVFRENLEKMKGIRGHMHFHAYNGLQWYCLSLGRSDQQCMVNRQQPRLEQL